MHTQLFNSSSTHIYSIQMYSQYNHTHQPNGLNLLYLTQPPGTPHTITTTTLTPSLPSHSHTLYLLHKHLPHALLLGLHLTEMFLTFLFIGLLETVCVCVKVWRERGGG